MKKSYLFLSVFLALFMVITNQSCSDDEDDPDDMMMMEEETPDFIADDQTFAGLTSWTLSGEESGLSTYTSLGGAHGAATSTSVRKIYYSGGQDPANGEYPMGTLIAKHVSDSEDASINQYFGMVKRGADYDPAGGNWEWFILNADGTIQNDPDTGEPQRGDSSFKACGSCHAGAAVDFAFTKGGPSDFNATDAAFANFSDWTLVATEVGDTDPLLQGGAHGGNSATSVREIYFKDDASIGDNGYPVGTLIAKHVSDSDDPNVNAYFGMVKRGSTYDSANGNWEWFILNADGSVVVNEDGDPERGDSSFKACSGCHAAAAADFVFSK